MNIFSSVRDAILAAVLGLGALVTGLFAWKAKRANTRADEATERAQDAERQVKEVQAVNTTQERAHAAVEKVRKKPIRKPSKKRDDFEKQ